jgi:hypothetical protein
MSKKLTLLQNLFGDHVVAEEQVFFLSIGLAAFASSRAAKQQREQPFSAS